MQILLGWFWCFKESTISIENTHLASGGSIVPYDHIKLISKVAKENNLKLHMDGARIWHAILQEKSTTDYGYVVDSLTFCFSKALGAPIGSMLLGSADFIAEAREFRKKLGGGMRQVGVIASMARASLESKDNLLQDHKKANSVYENISKKINNEKITSINYKNTNMILLKIAKNEEPNKFLEILNSNDIKSGLLNKDTIRFVFHKDIPIEDVDKISDKIIHSSSEF